MASARPWTTGLQPLARSAVIERQCRQREARRFSLQRTGPREFRVQHHSEPTALRAARANSNIDGDLGSVDRPGGEEQRQSTYLMSQGDPGASKCTLSIGQPLASKLNRRQRRPRRRCSAALTPNTWYLFVATLDGDRWGRQWFPQPRIRLPLRADPWCSAAPAVHLQCSADSDVTTDRDRQVRSAHRGSSVQRLDRFRHTVAYTASPRTPEGQNLTAAGGPNRSVADYSRGPSPVGCPTDFFQR